MMTDAERRAALVELIDTFIEDDEAGFSEYGDILDVAEMVGVEVADFERATRHLSIDDRMAELRQIVAGA